LISALTIRQKKRVSGRRVSMIHKRFRKSCKKESRRRKSRKEKPEE
jgi:hypothetical protein